MIELTVDWQKIITLDDIPNRDADGDDTGASDPLRSENGNLYGFCDDPRLGNRIVVVKNFTPWTDQDLPEHGSAVFHAVPELVGPCPAGTHQQHGAPRNAGGDKSEPLPAVGACETRRKRHPNGGGYFAGREWVDRDFKRPRSTAPGGKNKEAAVGACEARKKPVRATSPRWTCNCRAACG